MNQNIFEFINRHLPIQRGLFNEYVHRVKEQLVVISESPQSMYHDVLQGTTLFQWQHKIDKLPSQSERHEFWHGKELQIHV